MYFGIDGADQDAALVAGADHAHADRFGDRLRSRNTGRQAVLGGDASSCGSTFSSSLRRTGLLPMAAWKFSFPTARSSELKIIRRTSLGGSGVVA